MILKTSYSAELTFRAHDLTVAIRHSGKASTLVIKANDKPCIAAIKIRVVPVAQATTALAERGAVPILHFPGDARHPAGKEAGVSWYNDRGEGWLRIISQDRALVLLDLQGWQIPDEAQVVPARGKRGPPKSMDLWLTIATLLAPAAFDGAYLERATGINRFNVYDWLTRAAAAGQVLRIRGGAGRRDAFQLLPAQVPVVCEYIRTAWQEWRSGASIPRLRPQVQYFVAPGEWMDLERIALAAGLERTDVIPTGVTWLEGHDGGTKRLSPEGNLPRLSFLCRRRAWDALVTMAHLAPHPRRQRPYDSEAVILEDNHPLWGIARQGLENLQQFGWPPGLRTLEAMKEPLPRIRDVAENAWQEWVHQLHQRLMTRQSSTP